MKDLFLNVVNMSLSASVVILAVLAARLLLARAPKKWSYLLWSAVGFRLCCPVSLTAAFSLIGLSPVKPIAAAPVMPAVGNLPASTVRYLPPEIGTVTGTVVPRGAAVPGVTVAPTVAADPMQTALFAAIMVWLVGIGVLVLSGVVNYFQMRSTVLDATRIEGNVYRTDRICSPFILGIFQPKIYVPLGLDGQRMEYVLEHERYHLKRGDHIVKVFAYALLALHWFNPLVWLAFYLMGKDMELSCDEKVLGMGGDRGREYSMTLLSFAAPHSFPAAFPLCFGETGVKSRIKNALNWRRPRTWVSLIAGALCVALVCACAVNPTGEDTSIDPDGKKNVTNTTQQALNEAVGPGTSAAPNPNELLAAALGEMADTSMSLRLGNDGVVRPLYNGDTWNSKEYVDRLVNDFTYTPIDIWEWPDGSAFIQINPPSFAWELNCVENTDLVMLIGSPSYIFRATPAEQSENSADTPYTVARAWYDEAARQSGADPEEGVTPAPDEALAAALGELADGEEVSLLLTNDGVQRPRYDGSTPNSEAFAQALAEDFTYVLVDTWVLPDSSQFICIAPKAHGNWELAFITDTDLVLLWGPTSYLFRAQPTVTAEANSRYACDTARTWYDEAEAKQVNNTLAAALDKLTDPEQWAGIAYGTFVDGPDLQFTFYDADYDAKTPNSRTWAERIANNFTYDRYFPMAKIGSAPVRIALDDGTTLTFYDAIVVCLNDQYYFDAHPVEGSGENVNALFGIARAWYDEAAGA